MSAPFGDGASRIALPAGADPRAVWAALRSLPGAVDVVVAETHACVTFDPGAPVEDLAAVVAAALRAAPGPEPEPVRVRVRYDGPDLQRVASWAGLGEEEVVRLHLAPIYTVRVLGFLPGFAYLGKVDLRIAAPRLPSPRSRVPAGAVGVAGARTGIYPFASPGGWNLIGSVVDFTPFDPDRGAALALGDRVRFERA